MANKKISALDALTAATAAPATDVVAVVDVSVGETKKMTLEALGQALPAGALKGAYGLDAAGTDTYVLTLSPAPAAYVTGMMVLLEPAIGNTGACSLNVNALGAKAIKYTGADPASSAIVTGRIAILVYDGTYFELANPAAV